MYYQMKEFSELTKIPIETLRYYEREEIIQPSRNALNYRIYSEEDKNWAKCVKSLKQSGMSIHEIKTYTFLRRESDETIPERLVLLNSQLERLTKQRQEIDTYIDFLGKRIQRYEQKLKKK